MAVTCSLCGHCWHRPPPMLTWHLWNPTQAKYTCQHWRAAISTMTPAWWLSETASWWPRETAAYMLILSEWFCVCSEIHKSKAQMIHKIKTGILKKLLDTIREKTMVEKNVSPDCWRNGHRPWIWWSTFLICWWSPSVVEVDILIMRSRRQQQQPTRQTCLFDVAW